MKRFSPQKTQAAAARILGVSEEGLDDATDAFKDTSSQMRSELSMEIAALEDLIKQKDKEGEKVEELN